MKEKKPNAVYLKDYRYPDYSIEKVDFLFELDEHRTRVRSDLQVSRSSHAEAGAPLVLNGEELKFLGAELNGRRLEAEEYELDGKTLTIWNPPESFSLRVETGIDPAGNRALEGLYKSGSIFCTQNEPEGMRRITCFIDRPDIMAVYRTTITAPRSEYPVLLSNGNPVDRGETEDGRHWVTWEDPFPKPSYLFALVAGDLGELREEYTTRSGRRIDLRIYCDRGNEGRLGHAMESLKKAMRWDEESYGLEYDLDMYMIVAVDVFNMGAMENKGLNIFNSSFVMADRETATDADYAGIERVVGHEYFHNWTGNRVTCRDWFQLTLKEGLTVFRDQEFTADMGERSVQRIKDVRRLRAQQFPEDAGPMAHPVRPESYIEINNFYTRTVYEKGAEVVRMVETLVGKENFRRGIRTYFDLYDGQAVTTDDFIHAMEEASGMDLESFRVWYRLAGTPHVRLRRSYDERSGALLLECSQYTPAQGQTQARTGSQVGAESGGDRAEPFLIPLVCGLLDAEGNEITFGDGAKEKVLELNDFSQTFTLPSVPEGAVPSLNRRFSAPIELEGDYTEEELLFLMRSDSDEFNRWEAGRKLFTGALLKKSPERGGGSEKAAQAGRPVGRPGDTYILEAPSRFEMPPLDPELIEAFGTVLRDEQIGPSFKALMITLPETEVVAEEEQPISYEGVFLRRDAAVRRLAGEYRDALLEEYLRLKEELKGRSGRDSYGPRELKNTVLSCLAGLHEEEMRDLCLRQLHEADNMSDRIAALSLLAGEFDPKKMPLYPEPGRNGGSRDGSGATLSRQARKALDLFYKDWKDNPRLMDKWLSLQASSPVPGTLERVKELMNDPVFDIHVPNKVRALIRSFAVNVVQFHHPSGSGYRFIADMVLRIDAFNPQMASAVARTFNKWKRMDEPRRRLMKESLNSLEAAKLSNNSYEVVTKILKDRR